MKEKETSQIRSPKMRKVLETPPSGIIIYGTLVIVVVLVAAFVVCCGRYLRGMGAILPITGF
jgi:hypothetical protein